MVSQRRRGKRRGEPEEPAADGLGAGLPADRAAGEPLHWWTFLSAYSEIGDCLFAQVVRIRDKLARNKKLDKDEREWYNRNRRLVDLRQALSEREQQAVAQWTGELPVR